MVAVVAHGRWPGSSSRTWCEPGSRSEICSGVVPTTRPSMRTAAPDGRDSTRSAPVFAPGLDTAGAGRSGPRTRASWNDTVVPAERASTATRRVSDT